MNKIIKIFVTAVTMLLFSVTVVQAIPAYPAKQQVRQPDGSLLEYYIIGDEYFHAFVTTDGYLLSRNEEGTMFYASLAENHEMVSTGVAAHNKSQRSYLETSMLDTIEKFQPDKVFREVRQIKTPLKIAGDDFPTFGDMKGVVLLVEFADNSFQPEHTQEVFDHAMNREDNDDFGATGSCRDYFVDQSMGVFRPQFDVVGPIKLKRMMSYYGRNNSQGADLNPAQMIQEACQIAHDSIGVDFSQYDFDNDGNVDYVYVFYAGYAESYGASSNTIWPHASTLTSQGISLSLNGKKIDSYACSSELKYTTGSTLEGIGTFCHEFSHVLGLPDMYNTYNSSSYQLGRWDVMDQGNYNNESHTPPSMSAYERSYLDWIQLTELDEPSDSITLSELTQNNVAYRISTADPNEFFTLENRQQRKWDAYQPGKGLMIIHVTYDDSAWKYNRVNSGSFPRYDLVEADGKAEYDNAEVDLYPIGGNDMFTDYSYPNSLAWNGTPTEKGVTRIKDNEGVISFRFMNDRLERPVLAEPTDITDNSFTINWESVENAIAYSLNVDEVLADSLNPVVLSEDFSLLTEGEYPKSGYTDLSETIDEYTHQPGWQGTSLYSAGGYLRIGGYGTGGEIYTPILNLSEEAVYSFVMHTRAYIGKSVNYNVALYNTQTGQNEQSHAFKATKDEQAVNVKFQGGLSSCRVVVSTTNERLFINDLRLLEGDFDDEQAWSVGPRSWVVDSVFDTHYTMADAIPHTTYLFTVTALNGIDFMDSLPSEQGSVSTTGNSTNIESIDKNQFGTDNGKNEDIFQVRYYDLAGRELHKPHFGIVIRKVTYKNGTTVIDRVIKR